MREILSLSPKTSRGEERNKKMKTKREVLKEKDTVQVAVKLKKYGTIFRANKWHEKP